MTYVCKIIFHFLLSHSYAHTHTHYIYIYIYIYIHDVRYLKYLPFSCQASKCKFKLTVPCSKRMKSAHASQSNAPKYTKHRDGSVHVKTVKLGLGFHTWNRRLSDRSLYRGFTWVHFMHVHTGRIHPTYTVAENFRNRSMDVSLRCNSLMFEISTSYFHRYGTPNKAHPVRIELTHLIIALRIGLTQLHWRIGNLHRYPFGLVIHRHTNILSYIYKDISRWLLIV